MQQKHIIIQYLYEELPLDIGSHDSHKVLDLYCTSEIIALYRRQLIQSSADSECAIDLFFTDIDFSKFTDETIEFYQDIFGNFLPEFLDAWQKSERRRICKRKSSTWSKR